MLREMAHALRIELEILSCVHHVEPNSAYARAAFEFQQRMRASHGYEPQKTDTLDEFNKLLSSPMIAMFWVSVPLSPAEQALSK